jgi:hypothetical protein
MRRGVLWAVLLGAGALGCDSEGEQESPPEDDYLGEEVVTMIPAGDAQGNAASGAYQTRATIVSCSGACDSVEVGGTGYTVCERDAESIEWVAVEQDDGVLVVHLDDDGHIGINLDGFVPVRLAGGIDADGGWDVGGRDTKFGGSLESTARARGSVRPGEPLEGTLEVHTVGVVDDVQVDCHATHRLVSVDEDPEADPE